MIPMQANHSLQLKTNLLVFGMLSLHPLSLPHGNDEFYDYHRISSATFLVQSLLKGYYRCSNRPIVKAVLCSYSKFFLQHLYLTVDALHSQKRQLKPPFIIISDRFVYKTVPLHIRSSELIPHESVHLKIPIIFLQPKPLSLKDPLGHFWTICRKIKDYLKSQ